MFIDLDVHTPSNRMAMLQLQSDGSKKLVIHDISSKTVVGEAGPAFNPQGPRFSPDGRRISFFGDGDVYLHDVETQSTTAIANTPYLHASFCEWSPDGNRLLYNAYPVNETDSKAPLNIYRMDPINARRYPVTDNAAIDRFPEWSPDGRLVAFHRQYPDTPNPLKQVVIADLAAGTEFAVPKESGCSQETGRFCWSDDSGSILVKERHADGSVVLKVVSVETMEPIWSTASPAIVGGAFRPGWKQVLCMVGQEIAVYSWPDGAELHKLDLGGRFPTKQTIRGPAWFVEKDRLFFITNGGEQVRQWDYAGRDRTVFQAEAWPKVDYTRELYTIRSRDGHPVPVVRLIPKEPKRLAVEFVFGGPSAPIDEHNPLVRHLLQEGYEVVCPVYRGQTGAGQAHVDANMGEMGRADVWDVVECGLDWKQKTGGSRPLALIGFSYGGLLTWLALADHPALWSAGVTLWGVTHLDHLGFYKSRAYPADPEQRETEKTNRSPLLQCRQIRTPLLMLHGAQDTTSTNDEVRTIQQTLLANGVPCELTIFPDDTHGLHRHRKQLFSQLFDFLAIDGNRSIHS